MLTDAPYLSSCKEAANETYDTRLDSRGVHLTGPDGELPEALQKLDPNILELVCNEILDKRSGIQWDDIAGQQDAKSLVQELVVWPMLNPHLFTVSLCAISPSPC